MDFKCYVCAKEFGLRLEFSKHLRAVHVDESKQPLKCPVNGSSCSNTFLTFNGLYRHIKDCILALKNSEKKLRSAIPTENIVEISGTEHSEATIVETSDESVTEHSDAHESINSDIIYCSPDTECNFASTDDELSSYLEQILRFPVEDGDPAGTFAFESSADNIGSFENVTEPPEITFDSAEPTPPQRMRNFIDKFANRLDSMGLSEQATDTIFQLTKEFIKETQIFCHDSITNYSTCEPLEILETSMAFTFNKTRKYDTSYKRRKIYEANKAYVRPIDQAIGTHWENRRDNRSKAILPFHDQSTFWYVEIQETLKVIFADDAFRSMYFKYNGESGHKCTENVYKDYCCGEKFKENGLFRRHPASVQIQLFTDGFEVCDPAKTKTGLHGQVAVYFAIRNLPPELAYSLNNIHLVALVNENDLKKKKRAMQIYGKGL